MHGGVRDARDAVTAAPSPSTILGQYATGDFGAPPHPESESLAHTLSTDNTSHNEMAPPRVTRPLPPAPVPLAPGSMSVGPAAALARVPPPPPIPKRMSLPPPTRTVPVPSPDSPALIQGTSPQRAPVAKRASLLPPSREIPIPTPDSSDVAPQPRQPSAKRTSLSPPSRPIPSPSISREGSIVAPPPPLSLGYSDQEPQELGQTIEAPQVRDELIAPPASVVTPIRKPSIAPPVSDGRRSMESRRSTDSRPSHEERRSSGQYATGTTTAVPGPISPPPKKRVPSSLSLEEEELLDDSLGGAQLPYCCPSGRLLTPSQTRLTLDSTPRSDRPIL